MTETRKVPKPLVIESWYTNPVDLALSFLAENGWNLLVLGALCHFFYEHVGPYLRRWRRARAHTDYEYHKDPAEVQTSKEGLEQQRLLKEASLRDRQLKRERAERRRQQKLQKYLAEEELGLESEDEGCLPASVNGELKRSVSFRGESSD
ncbi:uncharacterized protein LOC112052957 [Bicyclus anynana]|uniref:Uncharacterized protein LOC112052957 n=1 Tax=Bicyclus anynana TaxID=110368 RepID=A0A6J1NX23_BICAN|nr:uncharacterized protein LOC112052957 [Bicyclus anynana]